MKPNLRAVVNDRPHARDLARQRVKEWHSDAEQEGLPLVNRRDDKGAPVLDVDKAVQAGRPNHAPNQSQPIRRRWWQRR